MVPAMDLTANSTESAIGMDGDFGDNYTAMPTTMQSTKTTSGLYDDTRTARDWDDATWILTSSFIIFTMQSGFGMLESGCVSHKNEVNIMMKNVADVIFGGISYWMLGYGFSFGTDPGTNGFCGLGKFFLDPSDATMGVEYSRFVFQASFATTATTIVSGAVAERARFSSYLIFSFFNTFIYCFPAHWVWAETGWLRKIGVVDVAGDGPVHMVGGVSALVAAIMIKPRKGRFTSEDHYEMESPIGALLGLFILWWSWLAFNCGSTFGISGGKWKVASRAATNTLMAANSGGIVAFISSYCVHRKFLVRYVLNGVMAALVGITACCAVTSVKESLAIGGLGALFTLLADFLMEKVKIDDPVSAFAVHGIGGIWGLLATGLFAHEDTVALIFNDHNGLVQGGGAYLLGVQCLEIVSICSWTAASAFMLFKLLDLTVGLRLTPEEEEIGADFIEHDVAHRLRIRAQQQRNQPLTLPPRAVHVNPAYGLEDETDTDNTVGGQTACHHHKKIVSAANATTTTTTIGADNHLNCQDENSNSTVAVVSNGIVINNTRNTTVHTGAHTTANSTAHRSTHTIANNSTQRTAHTTANSTAHRRAHAMSNNTGHRTTQAVANSTTHIMANNTAHKTTQAINAHSTTNNSTRPRTGSRSRRDSSSDSCSTGHSTSRATQVNRDSTAGSVPQRNNVAKGNHTSQQRRVQDTPLCDNIQWNLLVSNDVSEDGKINVKL